MHTSLVRLSHRVVLLHGWRRALLAVAAGALSVLAMAPFYAWPVLFITLPLLVWMIDGAAAGRWGRLMAAAGIGWCFGFGYLTAGLYWIGIAFMVDAKQFAWLIPFAVLGLPAFLALTTAAGVALARALWAPGPTRILALAIGLTAAEWGRGHIVSGFPWNALGYALTAPLALAQTASLVGLWGLTFLTVAICASPAVWCDQAGETQRRWLPPSLAALTLIAMGAFGSVRLAQQPSTFVPDVRLRIMQPNLPQDLKFNYAARREVMARYLRISDLATGPDHRGVRDTTHLIWPESAFPFLLTREPEALAQIAQLLPPGVVLITGAARASEEAETSAGLRAYNSVYVIDHEGSVLSVYDKIHLVPFGEYLPFQSFLERLGLMQLTKLPGGFTAGDRRRLMAIPGAPGALPLICYEIIFPGDVTPAGTRPRWVLNVTNDAWFGQSTGPYQHFQQSRVRAIEEGLPLVRAANTGISAVVDPFGRILRSLPLGVEGVLDAPLPQPSSATWATRLGIIPTLLAMALGLFGCLRARRQRT